MPPGTAGGFVELADAGPPLKAVRGPGVMTGVAAGEVFCNPGWFCFAPPGPGVTTGVASPAADGADAAREARGGAAAGAAVWAAGDVVAEGRVVAGPPLDMRAKDSRVW